MWVHNIIIIVSYYAYVMIVIGFETLLIFGEYTENVHREIWQGV
jgi:hypothetical protein